MKTHININISETNLSTRAIRILHHLEIINVTQLISFDLRNLRGVRNCGNNTVIEITKIQRDLRKIENDIKHTILFNPNN